MEVPTPHPSHPYLARFLVGAAIMGLSFFGLILTDISNTGGFVYWRWTTPIIALLALGLSWYERREREVFRPVTLLRELFHWAGLIGVVFLISYFVHLGLISRFASGLFVLTTLALAIYLAGIYIEISFCFIGLMLALFAAGVAFFEQYLFAFAIPFIIAAIVGLFLVHWIHKKLAARSNETKHS